jgi:hypothetical protein
LKNVSDFIVDGLSGRQGLKRGDNPAIVLDDVSEGVIRDSRAEPGTNAFIHLQGKASSDIILRDNFLKHAKSEITFARKDLSKAINKTL